MITILYISAASYFLKIIPFIYRKLQLNGSNIIVSSSEYAVCFITGVIIVNSAFGNTPIKQLIASFGDKEWVTLVTLLLSFFICRKTGSILKSLFISMLFFILTIEYIS